MKSHESKSSEVTVKTTTDITFYYDLIFLLHI